MPQWQDQAIILHQRPHGESSLILTIFTRNKGRRAGLVRVGHSRTSQSNHQAGNEISVSWSARLEDQLGLFRCELMKSHAADYLDEAGPLWAMLSAVSLMRYCFAEAEPHPEAFLDLQALLVALNSDYWLETYIRWEIALLKEAGYGLDLSCCALSGVRDNLAYVSPRSGRAVTAEAAQLWKDRLLVLPKFLTKPKIERVTPPDWHEGLTLSGHFLANGPLATFGVTMPESRMRLLNWVKQRQVTSLLPAEPLELSTAIPS